MSQELTEAFITEDGVRGIVRRDGADHSLSQQVVQLILEDGRQLRVSSTVLRTQANGPSLLPMKSDEFDSLSDISNNAGPISIPVVEEEVKVVVHRHVTGKVRVATHVVTREETVDLPISHEEVDVQRVPVGRIISETLQPRQEGDTWVIPVIEEVLVVEKRLILREEIRLTTRRTEKRTPQTVTLRRTEATIERIPPDAHSSKVSQQG